MKENKIKELIIERAFNTDALSSFNCGIRQLDLLIHQKDFGLSSYITNNNCDFYIMKNENIIVAIFVFSHSNITVNNSIYDSLEIDFIAVKKEWWGNGIGTKIIKIAEENAFQSQFKFITVEAFYNKRYNASGFYEKNGFIVNIECKDKTQNIIPMYKILTKSQTDYSHD